MNKKKAIPNDELGKVIKSFGIGAPDENYHKLKFKDLMNFRVNKILLVCSLYDYYTIVEDGHLQEALFNEYLELNLHYAPHITRASNAESAFEKMSSIDFDLIITTLRLGDMELEDFSLRVKTYYPHIPLTLLASNSRELQLQIESGKLDSIDKVFIWSGDRRIFLAIIKLLEDKQNAPADCLEYGITSILLVEDSPLFYSAYLPIIYTEMMNQTQKLIVEGKSTSEKMLRQRARPKILHARNYEEAWDYFKKYQKTLLGVISDMKFEREGEINRNAGVELISNIKRENRHIPILLQSSNPESKSRAEEIGVGFLSKNSRTLLHELRDFMKNYLGFGDFIFRTPDDKVVDRAANLRELRDRLRYISNESLLYHSLNNHFSYWIIARTEFELAYKIRPIHIANYKSINELREALIKSISDHLVEERRGNISVFSRSDFDAGRAVQILGEGSLGGKARGLAFIDKLLKEYMDNDYFPKVNISIPNTIVIGTDVFTQFMEINNLYKYALENQSDDRILWHFMKAELPPTVIGDLREILTKARFPIAVRSSSLLEDAVYQPFAGVYATVMIPNANMNIEVRFHNLIQAIKFVYASTFFKIAKNYIEATGNRIEEEKMAVILQEVVGKRHEHFFYPTLSGVARSYNYYPFGKAQPKDGVVNLALGLGKTIVDGGVSLQYSPAYPNVFPQFNSSKDYFSKSQTKFFAIDIQSDVKKKTPTENMHLAQLNVYDAEKHGALRYIASTYSAENDRIYEGTFRDGPRVVNFAPLLSSERIPLNKIIRLLLGISEAAMNCPVEIEFAAQLGEEDPTPADFKFLQVRPMVKQEGSIDFSFDDFEPERILLKTRMALGNSVHMLKKILYVKPNSFDKSKTKQIASEINEINQNLIKERDYYLLIGPGRWGSSDPWLGVPVEFSSISAAQAIVEITLPDMIVDPSQGSHFFQNMTSFKISYLTLRETDSAQIDWDWLDSLPVERETEFVKLVSAEEAVEVRVNGQTGKAVAIK